MGKKKDASNLGRTLVKDRFGSKRNTRGDSFLHTSELNDGYDWARLNLQSVTEQSSLEEFLATAQLAGTEFTAEKLNVEIVDRERHTGLLSADEQQLVHQAQKDNQQLLTIPRRPSWDESTSAEQLDEKERTSFLEWRRQLAELSEKEHILLTPFERNLDFWRQLWRVIERSDIVVQIVDGRNPLLYRSEDLEKYVKEVGMDKVNMVLINKADLLTDTQRKCWASYFDSVGMRVAFWSAVVEKERIQQEKQRQRDTDETAEHHTHGAVDKNSGEAADSDTDSQSEESDPPVSQAEGSDPLVSQSEGSDPLVIQFEGSDPPVDEQPQEVDSAEDSIAKEHWPDNDVRINPESVDVGQSSVMSKTQTTFRETDSTQTDLETELTPTDNSVSESTVTEMASSINRLAVGNETVSVEQPLSGTDQIEAGGSLKNNWSLLTGDQLLNLFKSLHTGNKAQEGITTVGLVGYPNVGKSSTINALLQSKKVPVSATPGRTKHFQTLYVDSSLMLCDCPGLVMPTFVSTKAEMVVSGILPIDQMRDYVQPVSLVCHYIPRPLLEAFYGVMLPPPQEGEDPDRNPTAHELLAAYGYMRGFMTHKGIPDFQRSARCILKDYVTGALLYSHLPPDVSAEQFRPTPDPPIRGRKTKTMESEEGDASKIEPKVPSELDRQFFSKVVPKMGSKGVQGKMGYSNQSGAAGVGSQQGAVGKPWRKHGNKKKKEKLRRLHGDLDA